MGSPMPIPTPRAILSLLEELISGTGVGVDPPLVGIAAFEGLARTCKVEEGEPDRLAVSPPTQTKPAEAISAPVSSERQVPVLSVVTGGEKVGRPQDGVSEICSTARPDWQLGKETALTPRLVAIPSTQLTIVSGPTGLPIGREQRVSAKNWTSGPSWASAVRQQSVNRTTESPADTGFIFPGPLWIRLAQGRTGMKSSDQVSVPTVGTLKDQQVIPCTPGNLVQNRSAA